MFGDHPSDYCNHSEFHIKQGCVVNGVTICSCGVSVPWYDFEKADRIWKIMEIAIADFKEVTQRPDVVVNMSMFKVWESKICHVCLAGSILLKRYDTGQSNYASVADIPDHIANKLLAIDGIRNRNMGNAYLAFYGDDAVIPLNMPNHTNIPFYYREETHDAYVAALEDITAKLKAVDI